MPKKYPCRYRANGYVYESLADHPQVDTGLGFTCDAGVLDIVMAVNQTGVLETQFSCQGYRYRKWEGLSAYVIVCPTVGRTVTPGRHVLADFCQHMVRFLGEIRPGRRDYAIRMEFEYPPTQLATWPRVDLRWWIKSGKVQEKLVAAIKGFQSYGNPGGNIHE